MYNSIIVNGAREHNLKNVSVTIPKNQLTVFTGVSGSGKSSLAFDTIFMEGQRKYLESLSSYARQFFGQLKKPDVDKIEGLSPSISIEQKHMSHNPRSTVGTLTEIYDYLRLLFSSIGKPFCPQCGSPIESQTVDEIMESIFTHFLDKKTIILAPLIREKKGEFRNVVEQAKKDGFLRLRVDGSDFHLDEPIEIDKHKKHNIDLIIDRLIVKEENRKRFFESLDIALQKGKGTLLLDIEGETKYFSSLLACAKCDISFPEINPGLFSFNNPFGACEYCKGLGVSKDFQVNKLLPTLNITFNYWLSFVGVGGDKKVAKDVDDYLKENGFSLSTYIKDLSVVDLNEIMNGSEKMGNGLIPILRSVYQTVKSDYRRSVMERLMENSTCPVCNGKRLKKEVLSIKIDGYHIIDLTEMSISKLIQFMNTLKLTQRESKISKQILLELKGRLSFLKDIGLDYLTLARASGSLSGGESQRLRLATQMGFGLTGVLYVLDEPTIGLHPRDTQRLIDALKKLRDLGNTLIVVEHDREVMGTADHIVEIGEGAGKHGGSIMFSGSFKQYLTTSNLSAKYLNNILSPVDKGQTTRVQEKFIKIWEASEHNLQKVNVTIPIGNFVCVTGVSGSGKSTLIFDVFYRYTKQANIGRVQNIVPYRGDKFKLIEGLENIDKMIVIDQSPIGRTPRSNPATYTGVFDAIRNLFMATKEAKIRGYKPGRFSFNVPGGRCESCSGDGSIKIEMLFLPDVYVPCEVCKGKRYNSQTLEVKYKGYSIADVLAMTVEEAAILFKSIPAISKHLDILLEVGLGYISLGQSSTTLSGGEAQRIKLATELSKKGTGKTLYILDEPTTGLHFADVHLLLKVLQTLVDRGNTVLVIEHNTDVIKSADWIVDLGPEGGERGGSLVFEGKLDGLMKSKISYTAKYL